MDSTHSNYLLFPFKSNDKKSQPNLRIYFCVVLPSNFMGGSNFFHSILACHKIVAVLGNVSKIHQTITKNYVR